MIVAIGGIGSILMLSSASAPSRVPQVVWNWQLAIVDRASDAGLETYLRDGHAAVQLD